MSGTPEEDDAESDNSQQNWRGYAIIFPEYPAEPMISVEYQEYFHQNEYDKIENRVTCDSHFAGGVEGKHALQNMRSLTKGLGAEKYPGGKYLQLHQHYTDITQVFFPLQIIGVFGDTLRRKEQCVQCSPDQKVPCRAVPQSGKQKRDPKIPDAQESRSSVFIPSAARTAQRDVDVIAEPGRKRNVPSSPELLETSGNVRMIEVQRKTVAHPFYDAAGYVAVSGKVAVDLNGKQDHRKPPVPTVLETISLRKTGVDIGRDVIRQKAFLEKAEQDQFQRRVGDHPAVLRFFQQFRQQIACPDDRSGDKLRKQHQVCHIMDITASRDQFSPIYIDRIAHALEREETDPHRQDQTKIRNMLRKPEIDLQPLEKLVDDPGEKQRIFE